MCIWPFARFELWVVHLLGDGSGLSTYIWILTLLRLCCAFLAEVSVWYVSNDGDDTADCQTVRSSCRNLQTVLDRAEEGAHIYVVPETLVLKSQLCLLKLNWFYQLFSPKDVEEEARETPCCLINSSKSYTLTGLSNSTYNISCQGWFFHQNHSLLWNFHVFFPATRFCIFLSLQISRCSHYNLDHIWEELPCCRSLCDDKKCWDWKGSTVPNLVLLHHTRHSHLGQLLFSNVGDRNAQECSRPVGDSRQIDINFSLEDSRFTLCAAIYVHPHESCGKANRCNTLCNFPPVCCHCWWWASIQLCSRTHCGCDKHWQQHNCTFSTWDEYWQLVGAAPSNIGNFCWLLFFPEDSRVKFCGVWFQSKDWQQRWRSCVSYGQLNLHISWTSAWRSVSCEHHELQNNSAWSPYIDWFLCFESGRKILCQRLLFQALLGLQEQPCPRGKHSTWREWRGYGSQSGCVGHRFTQDYQLHIRPGWEQCRVIPLVWRSEWVGRPLVSCYLMCASWTNVTQMSFFADEGLKFLAGWGRLPSMQQVSKQGESSSCLYQQRHSDILVWLRQKLFVPHSFTLLKLITRINTNFSVRGAVRKTHSLFNPDLDICLALTSPKVTAPLRPNRDPFWNCLKKSHVTLVQLVQNAAQVKSKHCLDIGGRDTRTRLCCTDVPTDIAVAITMNVKN